VAQEVRNQIELWKKTPDNSLFPAPIVMREMGKEQIAQVYDVWRLVGCVTAKSIVDDRIVDFPFNPLFWDLVLGKKTSLFDLNKIQPEVSKNLLDFQRMANRRKQIV
jgi:HECT-domain (ubiquitin-transferase)